MWHADRYRLLQVEGSFEDTDLNIEVNIANVKRALADRFSRQVVRWIVPRRAGWHLSKASLEAEMSLAP